MLTMQQDPAFAREALRAGALGYVLKHSAGMSSSTPFALRRPETRT